jgi:biopolymer transport protein ExbB/TolQ
MDWRLTAAQHAAERTAVLVHRDMARGLDGLATVAATAPFMGLFVTVFGIIGSFRGIGSNRASWTAALANDLSASLAPAAFALAIATLTSAAHHHLRAQLADFDTEMHHAIRNLITTIARL